MRPFIIRLREDRHARAISSGVPFTYNGIEYESMGLDRSTGKLTARRLKDDEIIEVVRLVPKRPRVLYDRDCYGRGRL